jgi:hypothetical protein
MNQTTDKAPTSSADRITKRLSNGHVIRMEKRRGKYDVIRNTVGIASAWHYIEKGVTADRARNTFDLLVIGG